MRSTVVRWPGVGPGLLGAVPVRDSKTPTAGLLFFSAASWSRFVDGVKGEGGGRTFG
ncbi:DUF397 domain-containing protein [Streptomyces guryensis]|uniref:DUF397 domain-containing protein n=1 Tax=Streptomyces guryensis TaxID=2886947 RepID=A0A9Q3VY35_9ACTN|nr:DUF397 domain-containing protein [Streptomyces guryensis]MCD9880282.1 DUF397 domain-containing protein [Streptomyces guryensis]